MLLLISWSIVCTYRKERSKRPHQSKQPGALQIAKNRKKQKNGANAPGRLVFFSKLPNAPGLSFSRFFERKAPWGEPTTREGVRKGPAAENSRSCQLGIDYLIEDE